MEAISPDRVRLTAAEGQSLGEDCLRRVGYDEEEARVIAAHCMDAALCGYEYSGLPKILNVAEHKRLKLPRRKVRITYETPVSARMDGGNNNGMIAVWRAAQVAIAKAKENGFSVVGMNNSWMSGRSAHYTEMAAREGLICLHSVSTFRHVAPPGAAAGRAHLVHVSAVHAPRVSLQAPAALCPPGRSDGDADRRACLLVVMTLRSW